MRVLLLLPYAWDTAPGQRFRIEQWVPHLKEQGVTFEVDELMTPQQQKMLHSGESAQRKARMILETTLRRRSRLSESIKGADVIWLHRTMAVIGPPWMERRLARCGVPMIYEFDDAIWKAETARANRMFAWLKYADKTQEICRLSHTVVVGNAYLAEFASQFARNVEIVPTTIDTESYRPRSDYAQSGRIVVGWSGSITTSAYLKPIAGALQRVAKSHDIVLKVIGDRNFRLDGVPVEASDWSSATEQADLATFDIGLMPLTDDEWSKGKCGLKALQYMGMGIPTILSPVGVNAEIVRNGENGLWATTEDDWVDAITRMIESPELRERLGRAGRQTCETEYSATSQAPRVLEILRKVAKTRS